MNRRSFLRQWLGWFGQTLMAGWTVLYLGACRKRSADPQPVHRPDGPPPALSQKPTWKSLGVEEARTLEAALARLLPSNIPAGTPGAREARVIDFLDRQLAEAHFQSFRKLIQRGAKLLDQVSIKETKGPFHRQSDAVQDDILGRFQLGAISGTRYPTERFFALLHSFSLEGFLGHPRYGGNAQRLVWRSLGLNPHCPTDHGAGLKP